MSSHPNLVTGEEARAFREHLDYLRQVHGMSWDLIAKSIKLERYKNGADRGRRAEMLKDQYRSKPSEEVAKAVWDLLEHRERNAIPWEVMEHRVMEYLVEHPGARPSHLRAKVTGGVGRITEALRRLVEKGQVRVEGSWPPKRGSGADTFLYPQHAPVDREKNKATSSVKRGPVPSPVTEEHIPETTPLPQGTDYLEQARQALWVAAENLTLSVEQPPAGLRPYLQNAHREAMKRMADAVTDLLAKLE